VGFRQILCNGGCHRRDALGNLPHHFLDPSGFNTDLVAEPLPVTPLDPVQPVFPADPHRKPGRQVRINESADEVVKGRKPWSKRRVNDRKILGVSIRVSDERVEDNPKEKGLLIR